MTVGQTYVYTKISIVKKLILDVVVGFEGVLF